MKDKLIESISNLQTFCDYVLNNKDTESIITNDTMKQELIDIIQHAQLSKDLNRMKEIIAKVEDSKRPDKLW